MVPVSIAVIDRLPLTRSGKVDRTAAIRLAGEGQVAEPTVAASPFEALVAMQWAELLTVSSIGVEQDFFAAGGHSLLAMRALSHLGARVAGLFGAYGDEGVEDVHLVSSLLASLIVAVAVVCGANRLFRRPSRGN